jgi:hypothetical protein
MTDIEHLTENQKMEETLYNDNVLLFTKIERTHQCDLLTSAQHAYLLECQPMAFIDKGRDRRDYEAEWDEVYYKSVSDPKTIEAFFDIYPFDTSYSYWTLWLQDYSIGFRAWCQTRGFEDPEENDFKDGTKPIRQPPEDEQEYYWFTEDKYQYLSQEEE